MSEMVERVARAMHIDVHGPDGLSPDAVTISGPRGEIGQPAWKFHESRARAAIAAMRKATAAMLVAPTAYDGISYRFDPDDAENVWTAMIDEALRDPA